LSFGGSRREQRYRQAEAEQNENANVEFFATEIEDHVHPPGKQVGWTLQLLGGTCSIKKKILASINRQPTKCPPDQH
jgi:hypothetical protein